MGKLIGYARVSTLNQNEQCQLEGKVLDKVITDKASGKDAERPKLVEMIGFVRDGDTVVVHSMDRLARNLDYLRSLVVREIERSRRRCPWSGRAAVSTVVSHGTGPWPAP